MIKKKLVAKQPKKSQHDLFKAAAKEAGCDEKFDMKKTIGNLVKNNKSVKGKQTN
jgi:hypothetical protein